MSIELIFLLIEYVAQNKVTAIKILISDLVHAYKEVSREQHWK